MQDPLALKVLSGEFVPGDVILVEPDGDKLTFAKVLVDTTRKEGSKEGSEKNARKSA